MDNEIFLALKNISLEAVLIGLLAFILTMILKLPIKKLTAKLSEEKRKLVNSVIMFIPAVLSILSSILYFGIFKYTWISENVFEVAVSSWILSLTYYAIFCKLVIIIKGIFSGKVKIDQNLTKDTVNFIKQSIKKSSELIKFNKKELVNIEKKVKALTSVKSVLESNEKLLDLTKLSETNIELEKLEAQESSLNNEITDAKQEINKLNKMLYAKGDK